MKMLSVLLQKLSSGNFQYDIYPIYKTWLKILSKAKNMLRMNAHLKKTERFGVRDLKRIVI